MYSLDINFLSDRGIKQQSPRPRQSPKSMKTMLPLFIGIGIGVLLPLVTGAVWLFINQQTADLQSQKDELEKTLASQKLQQDEITSIEGQNNQMMADIQTLANIFTQIKPWSALLEDIRQLTPAGVEISSIQQTAAPALPGTPAASAKPATAASPSIGGTSLLTINGAARSFNEVNDFLLMLQRSPFFVKERTQLINAALVDNNIKTEGLSPDFKVEFPKIVSYQIQTIVSDIPASQLIRELDRYGAVGLVTRLKTLKNKGVIQP